WVLSDRWGLGQWQLERMRGKDRPSTHRAENDLKGSSPEQMTKEDPELAAGSGNASSRCQCFSHVTFTRGFYRRKAVFWID
ncbi:hypothetical protein ACJ73_08573, partial [Blastomyces percursus]